MNILRSLLSKLRKPKTESKALVYGLQSRQDKGYIYHAFGLIQGSVYTYELAIKTVSTTSPPAPLETDAANLEAVEYILSAERRWEFIGAARLLFTHTPPNYEILFLGRFGTQKITLIHRYLWIKDQYRLSSAIALQICESIAHMAVQKEIRHYLQQNFFSTLFWHNAILTKYFEITYKRRFNL